MSKVNAMPNLSSFAFAQPVPRVPDALAAKLAASAVLTDDDDELYNRICGVAPGFPEAFASAEARDAALGFFGPYVEFVPATWREAEIGGFSIYHVAIGHALRDPLFAETAPKILDAVASRLKDDDSHDVIVHRTRYLVRRLTNGTLKTYSWVTEFDGTAIDIKDALETVAYLDRELNRRFAAAR
jgi:hypothetical protein